MTKNNDIPITLNQSVLLSAAAFLSKRTVAADNNLVCGDFVELTGKKAGRGTIHKVTDNGVALVKFEDGSYDVIHVNDLAKTERKVQTKADVLASQAKSLFLRK